MGISILVKILGIFFGYFWYEVGMVLDVFEVKARGYFLGGYVLEID